MVLLSVGSQFGAQAQQVWGLSPTSMGSWPKRPWNNEFVESGWQNRVLAK